jgi:diacylglycerol kinase family enzyme
MDQIQRAHEIEMEQPERQEAAAAKEPRTLDELELVLASGGDGMINW